MTKIVLILYRIVYFLHQHNIPLLPQLIDAIFIRIMLGCRLQIGLKLGKNVTLGNGGLGIVIHRGATLEDNVSVAPNVSIVGTSKKEGAAHIGENSFIGTGARLLGPIKIGKNCYIGANAVVLSDIPDNSLAVGIPAKVIRRDIKIENYV